MPQNTSPIFGQTPVTALKPLTGITASTKSDGVGTIATDMFLCLTAGANGTYIQKIKVSAIGSVAATAMTATIIRFYISTKASGATTAADTALFAELPVAALSSANSANAITFYEIPCDFALNTGYTILASIHATLAANTSWQIITLGADY
jgi:hypothetical protein